VILVCYGDAEARLNGKMVVKWLVVMVAAVVVMVAAVVVMALVVLVMVRREPFESQTLLP
jgi:hypothetical protein